MERSIILFLPFKQLITKYTKITFLQGKLVLFFVCVCFSSAVYWPTFLTCTRTWATAPSSMPLMSCWQAGSTWTCTPVSEECPSMRSPGWARQQSLATKKWLIPLNSSQLGVEVSLIEIPIPECSANSRCCSFLPPVSLNCLAWTSSPLCEWVYKWVIIRPSLSSERRDHGV